MSVQPKNRFNRYGSNVSLDTVIKDCRDLQEQVDSMAKAIESMKAEIEKLKGA